MSILPDQLPASVMPLAKAEALAVQLRADDPDMDYVVRPVGSRGMAVIDVLDGGEVIGNI